MRRGVLGGGSYSSEDDDGLGGGRFVARLAAGFTGFTDFTGFFVISTGATTFFTGFLAGFGVGGETLGERVLGSGGVGSGTSTTTARGVFLV